jgi:hypothetical protein
VVAFGHGTTCASAADCRSASGLRRWRGRTWRAKALLTTEKMAHDILVGDSRRAPASSGVTPFCRVREHWSIEAHHHVRDVSFGGDTASSRTSRGPANLATIRTAIIAAIKDVGYLHIPEGRRDQTTPAKTLRLAGLD